MTTAHVVLLAAFLCGLCSWPTGARAEDIKVDLSLGWEDEISGPHGGLETAVFPRLVIGSGRIIVTTDPGMAPSSVRDRLASCGQSRSIEQFMACHDSAGIIMAPPQNAAVIFPAAGGPWKCSSTQVLNEKSYRVCASVQVLDARHLQLSYALEDKESNAVVTRRAEVKVELNRGECTAELITAQRNYPKLPGRVFALVRPQRPACHYSVI